MVKAYRDTWELGLHSYLSYLRDRLSFAKQLLAESGGIFVQISEDNIHHLREVMDEVFGETNFVSMIYFATTGGFATGEISRVGDYILWYSKNKNLIRYYPLFSPKENITIGDDFYKHVELSDGSRRTMTKDERDGKAKIPDGARIFGLDNLQGQGTSKTPTPFEFDGKMFEPNPNSHWKASYPDGMNALKKARRIDLSGNTLRYVRYMNDSPLIPINNAWMDTSTAGYSSDKLYVVQTNTKVVQRCLLMTTAPGDLVLDITCGSGTTAIVAEEWGRRWITCDTSRVPLALARQRLLTATFPWYRLKDPSQGPSGGFVYERKKNRKGEEIGGLVPRITLKSIANNEQPEMVTLVDRPEVNNQITRVSGPFTVEATIQAALTLAEEDNQAAKASKGQHQPARLS